MSVDPSDVLRVVTEWTWQNVVKMQNSYHLRYDGTGTISDSACLGDCREYAELLALQIYTRISDEVSFDLVKVYNVTQDRPVGETAYVLYTGGTDVADDLPPGNAALALGSTGVKRVMGKKYVGGLSEVQQTNGTWTAAFLTALANYAAKWVADFTAASLNPYKPGLWSKAPMLFRTFVEAVTSDIPAYQRRRRQGRGI